MSTEKETSLLTEIYSAYPALEGAGNVQRERRMWLSVPVAELLSVLRFAESKQGFNQLCTISGLDTGKGFEVCYHLAQVSGIVLTVKTELPRENPVVPSVLPIYNGAIFYERELEGILGIRVEGLPPGRQYPLPDNWPEGQYPLRKDWSPQQLQSALPSVPGAEGASTEPKKGEAE